MKPIKYKYDGCVQYRSGVCIADVDDTISGEGDSRTWITYESGRTRGIDGHHADRIARWLVDPNGPAILDLTVEESAPRLTESELSALGYGIGCAVTGWTARFEKASIDEPQRQRDAAWDACRAHYAASKVNADADGREVSLRSPWLPATDAGRTSTTVPRGDAGAREMAACRRATASITWLLQVRPPSRRCVLRAATTRRTGTFSTMRFQRS